MPLSITYDQWIRETYSATSPRSETLKKLDEAIKSGNPAKAKAALEAWILEQIKDKKDWKLSVRNKHANKPVEKLFKELGCGMGAMKPMSAAQKELDNTAKAMLLEANALAAKRMFTGKRLKFKDSFWGLTKNRNKKEADKIDKAVNSAKNVGGTATGLVGNANAVAEAALNLKTIIELIMGTLDASKDSITDQLKTQIISAFFGASVAEFCKNAAPAFGLATSGYAVLKTWVGVARNVASRSDMRDRVDAVRSGNAAAALSAVISIIEHDIKVQTAEGVIRTAAFTAKVVGVADMSQTTTVVAGAIESVAVLLNNLVDVMHDARMITKGNKMIEAGHINLELFEKCPILGCYYLCVQDHSIIMNFNMNNMGRDGWQNEALRLRNALDAVLEKSAELIGKSRIEIPDMADAKGIYQSTLLDKVKMYFNSKGMLRGKKMEGFSSSSQMGHASSDDWKSRITGHGSEDILKSRIKAISSEDWKSRIKGFGNDPHSLDSYYAYAEMIANGK